MTAAQKKNIKLAINVSIIFGGVIAGAIKAMPAEWLTPEFREWFLSVGGMTAAALKSLDIFLLNNSNT